MFQKVLIANRGEVAGRIARTVKRLGAEAIGIFSDAEVDAMHRHDCDESLRVGPGPAAESYANVQALLAAADAAGADAIHPGYGFLAESADLARAAQLAGITFIGPTADALSQVTDRLNAKQLAISTGMRVIEGSAAPITQLAEATDLLFELGGIVVKAVRGGLGVEPVFVQTEEALALALRAVAQASQAATGDSRVFVERTLSRARQIEVQVLADDHGNVLAVGDRECSLQQGFTRLVDEAPATALVGTERGERTRDTLWDAAINIVKEAGCTNAVNVEFLIDEHGEAYFLEIRPALSIAHGVTEICSNIDLVEAQLVIAAGQPIPDDIRRAIPSGHAVEVRLCAEQAGLRGPPATGTVAVVRWPNVSPGRMRIESSVQPGTVVTNAYGNVLAKVITHAPTRHAAVLTLDRVLAECSVAPLPTNAVFLRRILGHDSFRAGQYDLDFVGRLRRS